MTPPPAPPAFPTYDFLKSFTDKHVAAGHTEVQAAQIFDHFFSLGYVFKSPHWFMIGGDDPDGATPHMCASTWYVAWAEFHPDYTISNGPHSVIGHFLGLMPYHRPFIRFGRGLRGLDDRIYRTDRWIRMMARNTSASPRQKQFHENAQDPQNHHAGCSRSGGQ
jgi:hypothetical protein